MELGIVGLAITILLIVYTVIAIMVPIYIRQIRNDVHKIVKIMERATGQSGQKDQKTTVQRFDEQGKPLYY